ncbi:PIN domain-containing protein [Sphaerimonospora sp. CA-214678]|uniref:PIN domain-containing protein n=1 Tax=Sphaerimonospora sp. CA-214678 TaxID=3240029 RepID=UPI003D8A6DA5
MSSKTARPTYRERLTAELEAMRGDFRAVVDDSAVVNIDLNRTHSEWGDFIGFPIWGWAPSDDDLQSARMALLGRFRAWNPRFRLLFPHATPEVEQSMYEALERLHNWLVREPGSHGVPASIEQARQQLEETFDVLTRLLTLLPPDDFRVRLTVDTNTLLDDPNLAVHTAILGGRYMVHLLPVVLREIDDLKRNGRNQDVRDSAKRADRRLKGLRANGDVLTGVRVAGDVHAVFEHVEPAGDDLPSWLNLDVPDDRFVASTLLLQSAHPGSALYAATGDLNLQTKLAAVGLPYIELP